MSTQRTSAATSIDDARYAIAVDWLQRLDRPEMGEDEVQAWLEWFGSSDLNRKAFEEASALRQRLRTLPEAFKRELQSRVPSAAVRRNGRGAARWYQRAALAAALCLLVLMPGKESVKPFTPAAETVYTAPTGKFRTVALEDGSSLVLGADAAVAVNFSAHRRALDIIRGGAYFEVRHDTSRPFVVSVGGVQVTAVGTAFKVSRLTDRVVVTVTEGVVEVVQDRLGGAAAMPLRLAVGQRKELSLVPQLERPERGRGAAAPEWRSGRIEFVNTPLRDVLSLVNRYAPTSVSIDDPRLEGLTYSGTVERSHIGEWIVSLPDVYAIRTVTLEDGSVTLVSERSPELR